MKNFISYLEQLSDDDLDKIVQKQATLKFENIDLNKKATKAKATPKVAAPVIDTESIINKLKELTDRKTGEALLKAECPKKPQLEVIAKALDVFNSASGVADLRKKIIEQTIGSRLRSKAIQAG